MISLTVADDVQTKLLDCLTTVLNPQDKAVNQMLADFLTLPNEKGCSNANKFLCACRPDRS